MTSLIIETAVRLQEHVPILITDNAYMDLVHGYEIYTLRKALFGTARVHRLTRLHQLTRQISLLIVLEYNSTDLNNIWIIRSILSPIRFKAKCWRTHASSPQITHGFVE
ncbi:hypothetical protein DICVIV_01731 [Dictyocaulus viviparus]|uniref:Uncharacterized protein n=1 Tax=Dictyocaulus viviparus TaxID=29172 RepID=A0A0D8Y5L8_DICVI|nr:hypothetical protein DICVIV_01731 [Dictyocaulus viviparus]